MRLKDQIDESHFSPLYRPVAEQYLNALNIRGVEGRIVEENGQLAVVIADPDALTTKYDSIIRSAFDIGGKVA